jgi:hypothetical protein
MGEVSVDVLYKLVHSMLELLADVASDPKLHHQLVGT